MDLAQIIIMIDFSFLAANNYFASRPD